MYRGVSYKLYKYYLHHNSCRSLIVKKFKHSAIFHNQTKLAYI